jgi:hypothetical protein
MECSRCMICQTMGTSPSTWPPNTRTQCAANVDAAHTWSSHILHSGRPFRVSGHTHHTAAHVCTQMSSMGCGARPRNTTPTRPTQRRCQTPSPAITWKTSGTQSYRRINAHLHHARDGCDFRVFTFVCGPVNNTYVVADLHLVRLHRRLGHH